MPRPLTALALVLSILVTSACTGLQTNSRQDSSGPVPTATSSATSTPSPSAAPAPTVPPVDAALLKEATDVFHAISMRIRSVSFDGGFAPDKVHADYPKYLMGGALMNAIMQATGWQEEGYRRVRGVESLLYVQAYPAMDSGSLVALTGCRQKTDVFMENKDKYGYEGTDDQLIVFLKRDTDGLLKIFQIEYLPVESCTTKKAKTAVVQEAAKTYGAALTLFEKYLTAGGLHYNDYPSSGLGPLLGPEARHRMLWELELVRTTYHSVSRAGPSRHGRVSEWPYSRDGSVVALTSCFDRSQHIYTNVHGSNTAGPQRIFFAYFNRDSAGTLRLQSLDWIYADACG